MRDFLALAFIGGSLVLGALFGIGWIWESGTSMVSSIGDSISNARVARQYADAYRYEQDKETERTQITEDGITDRTEIIEDAKTLRNETSWSYRLEMKKLDTKVDLRTSPTNRIFDIILYLAVGVVGLLIFKETKILLKK